MINTDEHEANQSNAKLVSLRRNWITLRSKAPPCPPAGFPPLVYLPFLIVHSAPLVGGGGTQALSLRAQLLRTLLLGTSVDFSGGG